MKPVFMIALILAALILFILIGLQVKPRAFPLAKLSQSPVKTMPLPVNLPAPVDRFYRTLYGNQIPIYESVVITGRGWVKPFGIWLPARFVMIHQTGRDYRHYFETTFFGLPFIKINEGYLDGQSFFESPMGTTHNDPNTNQGANLALWAEGGWFPSLWITDSRARWQAVDDQTAILFVPYQDAEESFVVRFNPQSGLVDLMEAMRYRAAGDQTKILWLTSEVRSEDGSSTSYATWLDQGSPWAKLILEQIHFNLDVSQYIRARGQ